MFKHLKTNLQMQILIGLLLIGALLPLAHLPNFVYRLTALIFIYASVITSFNLLVGYCGLVSITQAGFFGVGAYTAALLSIHLRMNFVCNVLAGMLLTGLMSLLMGYATLRLKGRYLVMATMGINEVISLIMMNAEFLGGINGLPGVQAPTLFGLDLGGTIPLYYLNLAGLVVVSLFVVLIVNSPLGRSMVAVREDEMAAEAIGINTAGIKLIAFIIAGAFAGFAGGLYAHTNQFVSFQPFVTGESFIMLAMIVIGGIGTLPGPILGVALLLALPEALRGAELYRYILYGIALTAVAPIWPGGLASICQRWHHAKKKILVRDEGEPA